MECLHFAICYSTFFTISFKCSIAEHLSTFGEKWAFSEIQPRWVRHLCIMKTWTKFIKVPISMKLWPFYSAWAREKLDIRWYLMCLLFLWPVLFDFEKKKKGMTPPPDLGAMLSIQESPNHLLFCVPVYIKKDRDAPISPWLPITDCRLSLN